MEAKANASFLQNLFRPLCYSLRSRIPRKVFLLQPHMLNHAMRFIWSNWPSNATRRWHWMAVIKFTFYTFTL